jgi:phage-related minor tail protein
MTQQLTFALGLDSSQYDEALGRAERSTRAFGATAQQAGAGAERSMAGIGPAAQQAADAQQRFMRSLQDQLTTLTMGDTQLLRYKASQLGIAYSAGTLIDKLSQAREAVQAKAAADSIAATAARQQAAAAEQQASAQQRFLAALREQSATQGMSPDQLLRYRAAQLGVGEQAEHLITQLHAQGKAGTASAAQINAAMRTVPAQFTDIVTSLQGGQNPLTVLLQQGGQLKDQFGGVGTAAKALGGYVLGLINPVTVAAAAVAALGVAYASGAAEATGYSRALIMSGNAAGLTASQMGDMAARIDGVAGTQAKAAEVLTLLAGQAGTSAAGIERMAQAAILLERSGGPAVEETAAAFAQLGKEPLQASIKLNEATGYLTMSVYQQIKALEDQGRTVEAAALAQESYASAMTQRAMQLEGQLGLLQRAWRGIKDGAAEGWDAMLSIGRADTATDKIKKLSEQIEHLQLVQSKGLGGQYGNSSSASIDRQLAALQTQRAAAEETDRLAQRSANALAEQARQVKARVEWDKTGTEFMSKQAKMAQEIAKAQNIGSAAGASQAEIDARLAEIRAKYTEKKTEKKDPRDEAGQRLLEQVRDRLDAARMEADQEVKLTDVQRLSLKIMEQLRDGKAKLSEAQRTLIGTQLEEISAAEKLAAQRAADAAWMLESATANSAAQDAAAKRVTDLQAQVQAQQDANAQARLGAAALADLQAARLDEAAATAEQRARWAEESLLSTDIVETYRAQAQALRDLAIAKTDGANIKLDQDNQKARDKTVEDYLKSGSKIDLTAGFDSASQSLGKFVQTFSMLVEQQQAYNKARADAIGNAEKLASVEATHVAQQLEGYAGLIGAAKSYAKSGSKDYKALEAAEKAFRAVELGIAIMTAARKIGLIGSVTAATVAGSAQQAAAATASIGPQLAADAVKGSSAAAVGVAEQAQGDPYTALPRMAAMAAVMAALGFATGAFGGGGHTVDPGNTGTGTVLGDSGAQSASISKAIEDLGRVDTMTMRYSAQMLNSLRSIEDSMSGLANIVARSTGVDVAALGIDTSTKLSNVAEFVKKFDLIGNIASSVPLIGGILGRDADRLASLLGSSSTSIDASGLYAASQKAGDIIARGIQVQQYADTTTTEKTFGIKTGSSSDTVYGAASAEIKQQFTTIIRGFADSIGAAGQALGLTAQDVSQRIAGVGIDLGKINLQGLSGADIQDRLSAVFSSAGDRLAAAALGGLERFQKVGEGYYQTLVRVASGTEEAQVALDRLGVAAISYTQITRAQSDVAAEIVRQSIQAREGLSGIADIISTLGGSAADLGSAYSMLTGIRTQLQAIGIQGDAVGRSLITGAGGLQELQDAAAAFADRFGSAQGQLRGQVSTLTAQFGALGYALPSSANDFRSLVSGIDTSTEAGQKLLGQVLRLSSGFGDLLDAIQAATGGLTAEIERIRALQAGGADQSTAALQARFAVQTAAARAGDQTALDALPQISQALLSAAESSASSALELARIRASTLTSLQATLDTITTTAGLPKTSIPGYAAGGNFPGGLRIVGERGAELEATGPARIYPAAQTAAMLRGGGGQDQMLDELRALRLELAALRADQISASVQIATNTGRMQRTLDRVAPEGDALQIRQISGETIATVAG